MSTPPRPLRVLIEVAICFAIASAARAATSAGVAVPIATLVLFSSMGLAGVVRILGKRPAPRLHYEVTLSLGLILLGVQLVPENILKLGWSAPLWVLGYQLLVGTVFYAAVRARIFEKRTGGLLAMGISGSGLSSVLATMRSDPNAPEDVAPLVLSGLLCTGALGFVLFPMISVHLGLDAGQLARWSGVAMPTTAESVLVGASHSAQALHLTGAWRLLINLMQGIPIAAYLVVFTRNPNPEASGFRRGLHIAHTSLRGIPLFVWGLSLVGVFSCVQGFRPEEREVLSRLTTWAFLTALAGIGWNTRPRDLLRYGALRVALIVVLWMLCVCALLAAILKGASLLAWF